MNSSWWRKQSEERAAKSIHVSSGTGLGRGNKLMGVHATSGISVGSDNQPLTGQALRNQFLQFGFTDFMSLQRVSAPEDDEEDEIGEGEHAHRTSRLSETEVISDIKDHRYSRIFRLPRKEHIISSDYDDENSNLTRSGSEDNSGRFSNIRRMSIGMSNKHKRHYKPGSTRPSDPTGDGPSQIPGIHPAELTDNTSKNLATARRMEEMKLRKMGPRYQMGYLVENSHFNLKEVETLIKMFKHLVKGQCEHEITRKKFKHLALSMFGISNDIILDQICAFFEADRDGWISVTEFILGLSTMIRGDLEEHIAFCYFVYDLNGDGSISRTEIRSLIIDFESEGPEQDAETRELIYEEVNAITEILMKKMDTDRTGQITLESFRIAVLKDPPLLQSLGKCLPDEDKIIAFNAMFTDDFRNYTTNYSLPKLPAFTYERLRFNTTKIMAFERNIPFFRPIAPSYNKTSKKEIIQALRGPRNVTRCFSNRGMESMEPAKGKRRRTKVLDSVLLDHPIEIRLRNLVSSPHVRIPQVTFKKHSCERVEPEGVLMVPTE